MNKCLPILFPGIAFPKPFHAPTTEQWMLNLTCQHRDLCLESSLGSKATVKHEGHKLSEWENFHTAGFLLRSHLHRWLVSTGVWEQQIYFVMPCTSHAAHSPPHKCIKSPPNYLPHWCIPLQPPQYNSRQLISPTHWKLLVTLNNNYGKLPGEKKNTRLLAGIEGKCKPRGWCNWTQIWYTTRICR